MGLALLLTSTACATRPTPSEGDGSATNPDAPAVSSDAPSSSPDTVTESADEPTSAEIEAAKEASGLADLEATVEAIAPPAKEIPPPPTEGVMLALDEGGFKLADVQTGSIKDLPFEAESDRVHQVVTQALGEPTETGDTPECPAGPLTISTWPNGLSLNTVDDKFVGWSVRSNPESETLTTIGGVGLGTALSDLEAVYEVEVFDSSLGVEFTVGQMSGLLSSKEADGVITNLWAGTNCIFR